MKIPDKIRLNGIDYDVQFLHDLNDGERICDGLVDYNHSLISINPSTVGYQQQCIVFLHEVCHAILQLHDCANAGENARVPKDEEELLEVFARGFYQFLQDNGAALFDMEKEDKQ